MRGGGVDGGEKLSGVWVWGVFTIWTTKTTRTQTGGREGGKGPSWWDVSKHGGLTSTETIRFIWDGEGGGGGIWRRGKREIISFSLHCDHQNDSCIEMGSDKSHFNASLIVRDGKVTRPCPQTTTFEERMIPALR